jgi:hypothetical protein
MDSALSEQGRSMAIMVYHEYFAFHGMGEAWKSMVELEYLAFHGVREPYGNQGISLKVWGANFHGKYGIP